jgi:hypothetical protein
MCQLVCKSYFDAVEVLDLLHGGIVVSVRVNDAASETTRRILGDSEIPNIAEGLRRRGRSARGQSG